MEWTCPNCGAKMRVAGAYRRQRGARPNDGEGKVPSEGRYDWGKVVCHQCGALTLLSDTPPPPESYVVDASGGGKVEVTPNGA